MCNQFTFPSSIRDWYLEVKIWATDRRYSSRLWILWTKSIRILRRSTWVYRVMHNTCTKHWRETSEHGVLGRHQSCSEERIEVLSDLIDRNHSSRNTLSLSYFESLFGWKLEKSKVTRILMWLTWMYHVHAQYLHNAWKRHQDAENWVDINLAIKKGLTFYQTRWNAFILQESLSSLLYSKSC